MQKIHNKVGLARTSSQPLADLATTESEGGGYHRASYYLSREGGEGSLITITAVNVMMMSVVV